MSTFPGFSPKALTFFRQLARNNDRDWFTAHKTLYVDHVETPMIELVATVGDAMKGIAGEYVREPKKHLYRIYRDTRFSKDKTPYKTHLGAQYQHPRVTKNLGAGFYFHLGAKELCIAGGIYMPGPDQLAAMRAAFSADPKPFRKIIGDKSLAKLMGKPTSQSAAKVPKEFEPSDPAADLLKLKQYYFYVDLDPKLALTPKVTGEIVKRFKVLAPLIHYLNNTIVAATGGDEDTTDIPKRPNPMF